MYIQNRGGGGLEGEGNSQYLRGIVNTVKLKRKGRNIDRYPTTREIRH